MTPLLRTGAPGRGRGASTLAVLVLSLGLAAGCTTSPGAPDPTSGPAPAPRDEDSGPRDDDSGSAGVGDKDGPGADTDSGVAADAPAARRTEPPPWVTRPRITRVPVSPTSGPGAGARQAFPRPAALGPGWTYRAALGDAGYVDGPAPRRRLDPATAARGSVPRGCPAPGAGPERRPDAAPERALTVAYEVSGDWVDATRITLGSAGAAAAFAQERRRALVACRGRDGGASVGPLVTRVQALGDGTTLSDRTPRSDAYSDVAVVDGRSVVVVTRRTDERPTLRAARALATAFSGGPVPGGLS